MSLLQSEICYIHPEEYNYLIILYRWFYKTLLHIFYIIYLQLHKVHVPYQYTYHPMIAPPTKPENKIIFKIQVKIK